MLLALHWWRTEHAHVERHGGRVVYESAPHPTASARAWGVVLFGSTGYAATFLPREARTSVRVRFGGLALGTTQAPEPVVVPEPEPVVPTRSGMAIATVLFGGTAAADGAAPRVADATTSLAWYGLATADMVRPRWMEGHGTWRVRGTASATAILPEPVVTPRRPWTGTLSRGELDTVAMIAMLYMEDR
jgi:hypothetical protein